MPGPVFWDLYMRGGGGIFFFIIFISSTRSLFFQMKYGMDVESVFFPCHGECVVSSIFVLCWRFSVAAVNAFDEFWTTVQQQ